eukprot:3053687-Amphidinium_carterae.1
MHGSRQFKRDTSSQTFRTCSHKQRVRLALNGHSRATTVPYALQAAGVRGPLCGNIGAQTSVQFLHCLSRTC